MSESGNVSFDKCVACTGSFVLDKSEGLVGGQFPWFPGMAAKRGKVMLTIEKYDILTHRIGDSTFSLPSIRSGSQLCVILIFCPRSTSTPP